MSRKTKSVKKERHAPQRADSVEQKPGGAASDVVRLEDRTREDLYQLAQRLEIAGHAELSKSELIEAIRRR